MAVVRFRNFTAASRKPHMIQFGMYAQGASLDVIESIIGTPIGVTGTQDGSNTTFTVSLAFDTSLTDVLRNGLHQFSPGDYSLSGTTLTWVVPPEADDSIVILARGY
jgi:hypothetical protein